jgi:hypothetical protein
MLVFTVYPGVPELDIKEVMNPQGDPYRTREYNRLIAFRKLMLIYRLIHFRDPIPDIDINIQRRNKELCKPCIQLFYGTQVQEKIEQTFQIFLDIKNSKRARSLEAILIPVIIELVEQEGNQVSSSRIWEFIKDNIAGESYGSDEYHIADYTLYRTTVTKLLEDKFGAEPPRHTKKGSIIIFDLDKLRKIERSYDTDVNIKTTPKNVLDDEGDSGDGSDRSRQNAIPSNSTNKGEVRENLEDISGGAFLQDPSHLSLPSPPSPIFSCYHKNCKFHTGDEAEYRRHGALNHHKNPLLFPSKFEIEKYGLTPQGKEWEI